MGAKNFNIYRFGLIVNHTFIEAPLTIAVIAHDSKKEELVNFVIENLTFFLSKKFIEGSPTIASKIIKGN